MADLTTKVENVFNETRILVLGIQILVGFGFRTFFEPGSKEWRPSRSNCNLLLWG